MPPTDSTHLLRYTTVVSHLRRQQALEIYIVLPYPYHKRYTDLEAFDQRGSVSRRPAWERTEAEVLERGGMPLKLLSLLGASPLKLLAVRASLLKLLEALERFVTF